MDNVTHSLAGMLLAEVLLTARRDSRPELRQSAYLLSALANNLPDIDVVYSSWLTGPAPLGSLIHHRGHTHTLLFAVPAAWLLYWASVRLWQRRGRSFAAGELRVLLGLALAGPLLHLLMDLGNNYGVHPFWPLSGRWFYGDTIFIIEPLWLALTIPLIAHQLRRRWLALLLWIILGTLLVVCWFVPLVLPAARYVLLALTLSGVALTRWGTPPLRVAFSVLGCLAVALVFRWGSARAQATAQAATAASFPALEVVDIAATPMPANPACWEVLVAGEQAGQYRVLRAKVALSPLSLDACPAGADNAPTAQVRRLDRPERAGVRFQSELQMPVAELRRLREQDCRFRALLQFTRLPYAQRAPGAGGAAERLQAGDLRYDRSPDRDFSDLDVPLAVPEGGCPRFVTNWREPITDVLAR